MDNPDIHKRRTIRLPGFNYESQNAYFITICAQNRDFIFGNIENGCFKANDAGEMVENFWIRLESKFLNIKLDEYILMPNHLHGIITIVGADPCVCPEELDVDIDKYEIEGEHMGSPLHRIIQWYKTMTTNEYIKNVKRNLWPPFNKRIWQRNYFEHIIRNDEELYKICDYIKNNPLKWDDDKDNTQKL